MHYLYYSPVRVEKHIFMGKWNAGGGGFSGKKEINNQIQINFLKFWFLV